MSTATMAGDWPALSTTTRDKNYHERRNIRNLRFPEIALMCGIIVSKRWLRAALEPHPPEWQQTVRLRAETGPHSRRSRHGNASAGRSNRREPAARHFAPWFYRT